MKRLSIPTFTALIFIAGVVTGLNLHFTSASAQAGCQNFPETGMTVCGRFLEYWQTHGALAQQGYPISGEFTEISELNGRTYLVRYFERAVFEYHPENQPPYDVLLSQLGRTQLNRKYPSGAPPLTLSETELKYRLLDIFGRNMRYCDFDYNPVGGPETEKHHMVEWYAKVDRTTGEFKSLLQHNSLSRADGLSSDQTLAIYRDYKRLRALNLVPQNGGNYFFSFITSKTGDGGPSGPGTRVEGLISETGLVDLISSSPVEDYHCPLKCLSGNTLISTPKGNVPVRDMKPGMAIWTADEKGIQQAATVLQASRVPVGPGHQMVNLKLADGKELLASPGHPLADGRLLGSLQEGDIVDGAWVISARLVPYSEGYTYDILPSGPTGDYWANGILLGSTLRNSP